MNFNKIVQDLDTHNDLKENPILYYRQIYLIDFTIIAQNPDGNFQGSLCVASPVAYRKNTFKISKIFINLFITTSIIYVIGNER